MNILHIINNLERGGAETMLFRLTNYDKENNIVIFNLIGSNKYKLKNKNAKIINFNFKTYNFFILVINFIKFTYMTYKFKPNKIFFWLYHSCLFSIFLKIFYLRKSKYYWNIRQVVPNFAFEKKTTKLIFFICKFFSFLPNKIIYNSISAKNEHISSGFKNKESIYIPNGFEEPEYTNKISPKILNKIKNKFIVSLFARYHLSKGHDIFLESIKNIKNKNMFFLLAGKNVNYENKKLINIININNIHSKVLLLDEISNVNDYLKYVDLLVNCSSSSEGFPNILGEAIMNDCICVASNISDNKKILKNKNLIINELTSQEITNKIEEVYNFNEEEKIKIKNDLKKNFINNYSIKNIAKMYNNL